MRVPVQYLGQSGWKLSFRSLIVYVDPYLSNSVEELDGPELKRLRPIAFPAESVADADYVLITHDHLDHCDPHTLPEIARRSPQAIFIGPQPVLEKLSEWGISPTRLQLAAEYWTTLGTENSDLRIVAVPAAHLSVERDTNGRLKYVGFIIEWLGRRIYIAGDTCADDAVIRAVESYKPIHTAILPVNEHNFYRARRGIVGNMSVREAFQFGADLEVKRVVAVHWDMFKVNSVYPEEIELLHKLINPPFALSIDPKFINLNDVDVSIVIRTLNEERYLDELLSAIADQDTGGLSTEVVLVDSGSTDNTLEIAQRHNCHIEKISKEEFSFGRSLNIGCRAATGSVLVLVSGHCIPANRHWIRDLCDPIIRGQAQYTYGRQLPGDGSYFSEGRIFDKYFPERSQIPQDGYFCNNANSALQKECWEKYGFDEEITGLEDMDLAQRLCAEGGRVGYVAEAAVFHLHHENWRQVRRRFEREAIALQKIMPQLHMSLGDVVRYIFTSVYKDMSAYGRGMTFQNFKEIIFYRCNQYLGGWNGNHEHRKLSRLEKEKFFYPNV